MALLDETVAAFQTNGRALRVRAPDHLEACLDPESVRQVVENLLSNALRHSPSDTPIDVVLGSESGPDGEWIRITVSNEGEGVPPDLLPRLFSRFVADSKSTGVGLGLYIASQIVGLHGGTITVDSAPGRGAQFRVMLPVDCTIREPHI